MPTCFILLRFTHICIFQHWRNKDIYYHYHLRTHCDRLTHAYMCQESNLAFVMIMAPCHFLNKWRFNVNLAYFDIRICVGLWSVCCRFVIGLSSGLSVCSRLQFQHCANDRFSVGAMSVIYWSQIGRFHTESYPKWPRHEPDWFYGVFSNIVGGRQLANSLKNLRFLSVSCRFGRCDWGISSPKLACY